MVRDARSADAEALATISVDGWQTAYVGIVPDEMIARQRAQPLIDYFSSDAANAADMRTLVVEVDDDVVGFAHIGPLRPEPGEDLEGCELWGMYVHSSHRGTGLGRMLMEATMDHFRGRGCSIAYLWVMQENAAARRFYESSGWSLDESATRSEPVSQVRYRIPV